ncbi:hypothetical protein FA15DRAFT_718170 [Coprinopsis marcescibilis]|uniref:Uncharacterized protein n=1 Tax=Coprinopsis marcescibilis TaxID=230819 RepID=A0A5C3KLF0_COPMA|nr:hypothetical protein FA15DRAFT_718170 [Coprinopsis marcescibilis]
MTLTAPTNHNKNPTPSTPRQSKPQLAPYSPRKPMTLSFTPKRQTGTRLLNEFPVGCCLIVRGAGISESNPNPVALIEAAITKTKEKYPTSPAIVDKPLQVTPFSSNSRLQPSKSLCAYIQLAREVRNDRLEGQEDEPRIDLLEEWRHALMLEHPEWEVKWAPAKSGKDKRPSIRFPEITGSAREETPETASARMAILKWLDTKGYALTESFLSKGGLICTLRDYRHADEIIALENIIINPALTVKVTRVKQIEIENAFEMIILAIPNADYEGIEGSVLEWIANQSLDEDDNPTLADHRTACYPMKARAINDGNAAMQSQFNDLKRLVKDHIAASTLQFSTLNESIQAVTSSVRTLQDQNAATQRALLGQFSAMDNAKTISDMKNRELDLSMQILIEKDERQRIKLVKMQQMVCNRRIEAEQAYEHSHRDATAVFRTQIANCSIALPTPTTPDSLIKRRQLDSASMDVDESQPPVRLSSPTHTRQADESSPAKPLGSQPKRTAFRGVLDMLRTFGSGTRSIWFLRRRLVSNRSTVSSLSNIFAIIILLSIVQCAAAATFIPPTVTSSMSVLVINANGFVQPVKVSHVNSMINVRRPHAFVIGETKTQSKVRDSLPHYEYDVYEKPGVKADSHHIFKWGIVLGICKDLQVLQQAIVKHASLKGRVVAVDVALPTPNGKCFKHRLIAGYAPWLLE